MKQGTLKGMETLFFSTHSYNYNYIVSISEFFFIKAVAFSDQSCQMMPYHTVSYFFAYGYSNSVTIQLVFLYIHNQITIRKRCSLFINQLKIAVLF